LLLKLLRSSLDWRDGERLSRLSKQGGVGSEVELQEANSLHYGQREVAVGEVGAPVSLSGDGRGWGTLCSLKLSRAWLRGRSSRSAQGKKTGREVAVVTGECCEDVAGSGKVVGENVEHVGDAAEHHEGA
jgi:hypothetical protein